MKVGVYDVPRHPSTMSRDITRCPREESNLRTRFRKPLLYPLSYEGRWNGPRRRVAAASCPTGSLAKPVDVSVSRSASAAGGVAAVRPFLLDAAVLATDHEAAALRLRELAGTLHDLSFAVRARGGAIGAALLRTPAALRIRRDVDHGSLRAAGAR